MLKALVIRHYGILWSISIMWELTEVKETLIHLYCHLLNCAVTNLSLIIMHIILRLISGLIDNAYSHNVTNPQLEIKPSIRNLYMDAIY